MCLMIQGNNPDFKLRVTVVNPLDYSSIKIEEVYPSGYARRSKLTPTDLIFHMVMGWQQVKDPH